jgi:heat-inducible transcriptional repressor
VVSIIKPRKKKILEAVIRDYINTAEPVGSRTLSRRYDLGVSPATIRNEMSDLEEMGYLMQPHTSSGRIPTQKAYRYYVDEIMQIKKLAETMRRDIHKGYLQAGQEIESAVSHTANVLSTLTNYTAVVLAPRVSRFNCKHLQIIPLIRNRVLVVMVTIEGIAKNIEVNLSAEVDDAMALKMSNVLNSILKDVAFQNFGTDLIDSISELTPVEKQLLDELVPTIRDALLESETDVTASGFKNLLNYPEFNSVDKIKNLVDVVEAKPLLAKVMIDGAEKDEHNNRVIHVSIGDENDNQHLKEFSIITSTYEREGLPVGAFGVIGPTRMNYSQVSSILDAIREELNANIMKLLK